MEEFSVDLMHKIFIGIPIKSLLQARSVSKSWCRIIDDPFFAHMQYHCGTVDKKTLLLGDKSSMYAAASACDDEEDRTIRAATVPMVKVQASSIYGSCNGLLYFAELYSDRIVVSNPLRSQFTILPPIPMKKYCWESYWTAIGLGFDSSTKTFKMVFTSKKPKSSHFTLVHTLGTTSWREVPSFPTYFCGRMDCKSVFVHGFLHWMTDPSELKKRMDPSEIKNDQGRILLFDVSKETFKVVPHPELSFNKCMDRYFRILDIKGNLGMLDLSSKTKFDLWVVDYETKSWGKEYTIDITIADQIHVDVTQVIGLWKEDEIMFEFRNRYFDKKIVRYWSYSRRTGKMKECKDQSSYSQVFSLQGSLISIPGAMGAS